MRKIIHISDMHFGRIDAKSTESLVVAFKMLQPDLVILSGDVTQRARPKEFASARKFLDELKEAGLPCFVIPGNHDIEPHYKPFHRVRSPYENYRKYISVILEPSHIDGEIAVAAINTVRNFNLKDGNVSMSQIQKVQEWFSVIPRSVFKIVVSHHPFDLPVKKHSRRLVRKAYHGVKGLADHNVDLYLSGHLHVSSVVTTAERYAELSYGAVAAQAGTLSLRQRGEVQSFNLIIVDQPELSIETYLWDSEKGSFNKSSVHNFTFRDNKWVKL